MKIGTNTAKEVLEFNIIKKIYLGANLVKGYSACFLDSFSDVSFAIGLERLLHWYTGYAFKVKRLSDDAELDIGFIANTLNIAALETFCSGTTGVITRWYNHKNNYYFDTTAGYEPIIVENGSVVRDLNGDIAAKMIDKGMQVTIGDLAESDYGVFIDCSTIDGDTESIIYAHGFNPGEDQGFLYKGLSNNTHQLYWGGAGYSTSSIWTDNSDHKFITNVQYQGVGNNPSFGSYHNGDTLHEIYRGARTPYNNVLKIGTQYGDTNAQCNMYLRKIVIINHYLSGAERTTLFT